MAQYTGTNKTSENSEEQGLDFKIIKAKVLESWYLFPLSIVICLSFIFIYNYFVPPYWKTSGKILVEDPNKVSNASIGGEAISSISSFFNDNSGADNELQFLRSRSLLWQLIGDLKLNVCIYIREGFKATEIYDGAPFTVTLEYKNDSITNNSYEIEILNNNQYKIRNNKEKLNTVQYFGTRVSLSKYNMILNKSGLFTPGGSYRISIQSIDETYDALSRNFSAQISDKQASAIDLELDYSNPKKGEVILEELMRIYIKSSLQNKVRIADSTMTFINQRLEIVGNELSGIERELQQFKQDNSIADIGAQSKALIGSSSEYVDKLNEQNIQLAVVNDLQNYINKPDNGRVVPSSLTTKDASFGSAINAYNELVLNREKLKLSYTDENPVIQNVDQQIESARKNLIRGLETYKNGLEVSKSELTRQNLSFSSKIKSIPQKERVFLDYSRKQNLKQELYLFLMQKREETAISQSANISSSRIIDHAKTNYKPLKPRKLILYAIGLFLGIALPGFYLLAKELLHKKVNSKNDIINLTNIPIIGEISRNRSSNTLVVNNNSRSMISERFRSLRTNLQYVLDNPKSNVLLFTSSMGEEGKSFVSINLGSALALSGKKVVFLELDLRKPKLSQNIGLENSNGFTNYIISEDVSVASILKEVPFAENCFLVSSGVIPPNPSELLMNPRLGKLIEELKLSFDYIIIDSPPVGIVTDALIIEKYADITFYIIRQGFTYKSQLQIVNDMKENKNLKKLYLIVNDVAESGEVYGYGKSSYIEEGKNR